MILLINFTSHNLKVTRIQNILESATYVEGVVMRVMSQALAVEREGGQMMVLVGGHHEPLPRQGQLLRPARPLRRLQGPQQLPERGVNQDRAVWKIKQWLSFIFILCLIVFCFF